MSLSRFVPAIVLTAVVSTAVVGGLLLSRPALAEPVAPTSACKSFYHTGGFENWPKFEANMAAWIDEHRATGLQGVSMVALGTNGMLVCTW